MRRFLIGIARKIGMDGAIAYSSGARILQSLAGLINIFFIATFLSNEEQGFFFTFGSILAIQVFFELGFTGIMTQYVAHEVAHLKLLDDKTYVGEKKYKSRLAHLVLFCLKWYSVISLLFLVVVILIGYYYFSKYDTSNGNVNWIAPWIILCVSTALKLFQSPFSAIYTGLGKVKEMNEIMFYQQLIIPVSQWILFLCGAKLYVVGISSTLGVVIWFLYVFASDLWKILLNLFKVKVVDKVNYRTEVFPYQWKIAVSWISGYFIYQLFNPILFATEGPIVAGQMGMTIQVVSAINVFCMSWLNTKIPVYSQLIELMKYKELDSLFSKTLKQMVFVCLVLFSFFVLSVVVLRVGNIAFNGHLLAERFLDFVPMILMILPMIANQYVYSWATYLRCHKQEPFLVYSVVGGVLCMLSTSIFGYSYGLYGICIGYCVIMISMVPWAHHIFITCKSVWHHE